MWWLRWFAALASWRIRRRRRFRPTVIRDPWRPGYYRGDEKTAPFSYEWLPQTRRDIHEIASWEDDIATFRMAKGRKMTQAEHNTRFLEAEDTMIARRIRINGEQATPETIARLGGVSPKAVEDIKGVLFREYFADLEAGLRGKRLRRRWRYMLLALTSK